MGLALVAPVDHLAEGLEDVQRLEPGHHRGLVVLFRDIRIRLHADDGRHVARQDEPVQVDGLVGQQGVQGRGHGLVETQHAQVVDALLPRHLHGPGNGRGRGLEPHADEDHQVVGVLLGQLQGVERRVHDLDPRAVGLGLLQVAPVVARHPHQVAEGGQDHPLVPGQVQKGVDLGLVGHAHRAPGPAQVYDSLGQQRPQPALKNGHRVRPAHLHEPKLAVEFPAHLVQQLAAQFRVMEPVQKIKAHGITLQCPWRGYIPWPGPGRAGFPPPARGPGRAGRTRHG